MCTSFSWIKCLAVVCSTFSLVSGHGRMIDPPQRSSLWREGWEVPKNYEDHSLNCGGFWHQWGEMDGKCGVCGDPYDSDRPNEAGGRYANGIIARTYDSTDEFIEVTIEVTASVGGYFEFKLCPHNDIYKPVKQSCLDQYPLRIEGNRRRLYPDLPLGKSGFVITKLNIPQGVTCKQCVLQWKWHGGNHWGMCTNGIGLAGCGPQTEFYNCADISILPRASTHDIKPAIKPRPGIPKQDSSSPLTDRKAPSLMTFIKKTTTVSSATSTRRKVKSETTTRVPFTTTQNTTSTIVRSTQEYASRMWPTPNIRTTLEYTSRQWVTPNIETNTSAIDYNTTPQSIPTTTRLLSTLDSTEYHTTMIPLEAKSATKFFSSESLSSNVTISPQEIGEMMDSGLRYMSALSVSAHNFTSATEEKIATRDAEISTASTRSTGISTSMWTPTPTTSTVDQSIRTSPNTTTTTVATTTQPTTSTTKPTTTSSTGTSTPISTSMPTTTTAVRSTTAPHTKTTTAATTTQPETIKTTTTAQPTSTITTQTSTRPIAMSLTISTITHTPIIEPKSTSQAKSTTPAPSPTTTPIRSLTRTIDLITAPTGSPKTSKTMTSSTFNPAQLINTFTETPTITTTKASTTTAEIHPTTTIFQTTRAKEATLPTTIKSTTKVIDKPLVRGSAPARREGGLSVATLFPFDLTRNLIDPNNSGINTEIKHVRRAGLNSLFNF